MVDTIEFATKNWTNSIQLYFATAVRHKPHIDGNEDHTHTHEINKYMNKSALVSAEYSWPGGRCCCPPSAVVLRAKVSAVQGGGGDEEDGVWGELWCPAPPSPCV